MSAARLLILSISSPAPYFVHGWTLMPVVVYPSRATSHFPAGNDIFIEPFASGFGVAITFTSESLTIESFLTSNFPVGGMSVLECSISAAFTACCGIWLAFAGTDPSGISSISMIPIFGSALEPLSSLESLQYFALRSLNFALPTGDIPNFNSPAFSKFFPSFEVSIIMSGGNLYAIFVST